MKKILKRMGFAVFVSAAVMMVSCNSGSKNNDNPKGFTTSKEIKSKGMDTVVYQSQNLILRRVSPHVYRHISYLNTNDYGKVECNGMVVVNGGKAVIFDTPANDSSSEELIHFINKDLNSIITAIIPTHFHNDCVGGLKTFGEHHIPGYASAKTIEILNNENNQNASLLKSFSDSLILDIGGEKVYAKYYGEGHTKDNIVGYFPKDSVLFGGCLIKELNASKGFLGDANLDAWPATVLKVKQKYPEAKVVIPGHGMPGGTDLLDYTMALFGVKK
ncbi:MAG: subclass B1 metallo-beta-lactamase [Ginsengibacter sp.]